MTRGDVIGRVRGGAQIRRLTRRVGPMLALLLLALPAGPARAADSILGGIFEAFGIGRQDEAAEVIGAEAAIAAGIQIDPDGLDVGDVYAPQLRRVLATEIEFFRKVCHPDEAQLNQIRLAGLSEVGNVGRQFAAVEQMNRGQGWPDARGLLSAALRKKAEEVLPKETVDRYAGELAAREAARKEAVAEMMVASIDRRLELTPAQFAEVRKKIDENWQPRWARELQTFFFYEEYAPLPDAGVIGAALSEHQRSIWQSRENYGTIMFGWENELGVGGIGGEAPDSDEVQVLEELARELARRAAGPVEAKK